MIDFVVDLGIPKDHATEYPALAYLRNGLADVLLVVRAPVFDAADLVDVEDSADLLESYLLPASQPIAWVTVPALRRLGLLPAAVGLPSFARQRAAELRARRFPLDVIARWLDTEGHAAPTRARDHWTRADVATLLEEEQEEASEAAHEAL